MSLRDLAYCIFPVLLKFKARYAALCGRLRNIENWLVNVCVRSINMFVSFC